MLAMDWSGWIIFGSGEAHTATNGSDNHGDLSARVLL
jgi:hypothetical protein